MAACCSSSKAGGLQRPGAFGGMGGAGLRGVSCFHCGSLNMAVVDIATALYVTISVSLSSSSSTSLSSSSCSEPLMSKLTKVSVSEAGVSGWDASLQMGEWVEHADELLVVLGA